MSGPDGLLVVDKPSGWTSHDVVARARRLLRTRKVGHAGTLDPMATGVLVLGVGRATRFLAYVVGTDKEYTATIRLGQDTVTDDAEGEILRAPGAAVVAPDALEAALGTLRGEIDQVPSAVSAIKVDGQRSYARVRAGQQVELAARRVRIETLDVRARRASVASEGTRMLDLDVEVTCSSGTYIRALARDLGAALGTGGHLVALRRTRVGPFTESMGVDVVDAAEPPELLDLTQASRLLFPVRQLDADENRDVRFGRRLAPSGSDGVIAAFSPGDEVVALMEDRDGAARPVLVLDPA